MGILFLANKLSVYIIPEVSYSMIAETSDQIERFNEISVLSENIDWSYKINKQSTENPLKNQSMK